MFLIIFFIIIIFFINRSFFDKSTNRKYNLIKINIELVDDCLSEKRKTKISKFKEFWV